MESLFRLSDLETRVPGQHERARRPRRAGGDGAEGGAAGLPRPPPRGAAAPRAVPARQDRGAPAHPGRPADRLPQPRRGDPHRPLRGRAEGEADRGLRARPTSRPRPSSTPACASWRGWRRWSCVASTTTLSEERDGLQGMLGSEAEQWKRVGDGPARGPARSSARRPPSARAARLSRRRRPSTPPRRLEALVVARADHRHRLRARLDPRRQGPRSRTREP